MEEKIIDLLLEMKQEMVEMKKEIVTVKQGLIETNQNMDKFREEMNQKINDLREEINGKMSDLRKEINGKMNDFRKEINGTMNDFKKEMLDRQFLFEDEYGRKIDAIFEYVQFQQKTNLQRFERIDNLEKRVSALERKNV